MRIAFIANHERTRGCHMIGEELEKLGHEIYWITPNRYWQKWLRARHVAPERILTISDYYQAWETSRPLTEQEVQDLRTAEQAGNYRMHSVIMADRHLRRRDPDYAMRYLAVVQARVRDFVQNNQLDMVSGEATWALELVTILTCQALGVVWAFANTIRMPSANLAFYPSHQMDSIYPIGQVDEACRQQARDMLVHYRNKPEAPYYVVMKGWTPSFKWQWIGKFLYHLWRYRDMRHDETELNVWRLVRWRGRCWWKSLRNRWQAMHWFETADTYLQQPYVLVALHVQPEATVDVLGGYVTDQIEMVRALSRGLPAGYQLLVKEHKNALAQRGIDEYRTLKQIPAVRLIRAEEDIHRLMKHARLTVTVAGTSCLEAGLQGWPAACIAPMVFDPVLTCARLNPYTDQLATLLAGLEAGTVTVPADEQIVELLAYQLAHSFSGFLTVGSMAPKMYSPENRRNLAEGYQRLIAYLESKRAAT